MASFLTASLVFALMVFSSSVSAGQRNIPAEPGDNVILPCRAAEIKDARVVEWSRTDLKSDEYVVVYRDSKYFPDGQSPSFRNRVDLLDVEKGNMSLVLKNVKTNDTGTYECRVVQGGNKIRNTKPICIINLRVEAAKQCGEADQGNTSRKRRSVQDTDSNCNNPGNKTGLIVGLSVFTVVVLLLVAAVLYKRSRYSSPRSNRPPAAADAEETLTGLDE